jgi:uncharacterized protein
VSSTSIDGSIKLKGKELKGEDVHDLLIEADLDQPDHAVVTLSNASPRHSESINEGDDLEIKLGFVDGLEPIVVFKGEVIGLEPIYDSMSPERVMVRALNRLHRLTRGKKSVAFKQLTDKDIVNKLCQSNGLTAKFGAMPQTKYEHVYQNNLTDLEFLRTRAARLGCEVFVVDKELHFRKRDESDSGIELTYGAPGDSALERFLPRLSTALQVSEVRVLGWDPDQKKEILGSAKPEDKSDLGSKTGASIANASHANVLFVQVESPVSSKEDADNIAKAILNERSMQFITGDAVCRGNPKLKPGIVVKVTVNDKRFDGKYYVTAVRHRYVHAGSSGGYRTEFKFRRDARNS